MATNIVLTFNSVPSIGTAITISDSFTGISMSETFVSERSAAYQSSTNFGGFVGAAANYQTAFNLDYNNTSLYTVTRSNKAVTITANNANSQFTVTSNTTAGAVTTVVNNETPPVVLTLNSVAISEAASNPCDNVKITATTNVQADNINLPISQPVATNPFVFTVPRAESISVRFDKNSTNSNLIKVYAPKLLASYFDIQILNTPSLASITVNNTFPFTPSYNITYSLDDVTYQSSNTFTSLAEGSYTLYIKDDIGCSISIAFTVDSFSPTLIDYDAYFDISNINSIRFKKNETWSAANPKTPYNTLSFEENVKLANKSFLQLRTTSDIIKTQFESNYTTHTATLIECDGTETALTITQMTQNMNQTDVRDGTVFSVSYNSNNYIGLRFGSGNTYDPITLVDNGDYNLGETLMDWLDIGEYVNIQGAGWYKILDIVYTGGYYSLVLNVLANQFPIALGTYKTTSIHNILNTEKFEFTVDFTNLTEGHYQIRVTASDPVFGTATPFLSEYQWLKSEHPCTYFIQYYNTENNEINYSTGITHSLRIPYIDTMRWKPNTEQDIYVTDTNTVNLKSKYRGFWEFVVKPLPTMMAEKLVLALLHDRLFIDGESYLLEGDAESSTKGGQYQITANLVKANYVFDSNSGLGSGEIISPTETTLNVNPGSAGLLFVD